jgi:hypothetical protein
MSAGTNLICYICYFCHLFLIFPRSHLSSIAWQNILRIDSSICYCLVYVFAFAVRWRYMPKANPGLTCKRLPYQ